MQYFAKIIYFGGAYSSAFFRSVEGVAAYWSPEEVPIELNFLACLYLHILV